jgi:hypothetical protein
VSLFITPLGTLFSGSSSPAIAVVLWIAGLGLIYWKRPKLPTAVIVFCSCAVAIYIAYVAASFAVLDTKLMCEALSRKSVTTLDERMQLTYTCPYVRTR